MHNVYSGSFFISIFSWDITTLSTIFLTVVFELRKNFDFADFFRGILFIRVFLITDISLKAYSVYISVCCSIYAKPIFGQKKKFHWTTQNSQFHTIAEEFSINDFKYATRN